MRLRTFTAADMPAAMAEVRDALGPEALILSTVKDKRGRVVITAAIEQEEPPPSPEASEEALVSLCRFHNVPEALAGRLVWRARSGGFGTNQLAALLEALFAFKPLSLEGARIMLVGPPGIGKTLAVARMATARVLARTPVSIITTDTSRAGGVEQLAAFMDVLSTPLVVAETPELLKRALAQAPRESCVLVDTAGCNPYAPSELAELSALVDASAGAEPVLALPAGMDSAEAADAARAFRFSTLSRLLITRMDTARRFGALLAAADAGGLAFAGVTYSARVTEGMRPLSAEALAQCLLTSLNAR